MSGILINIVCFLVFVFLQSLAINGWHECFKGSCWNDIKDGNKCEGNIFYKINPSFFEKHKGEAWTMPIWGCVKCESSLIGSITFWVTIIPVLGFHWYELWVWIADMFILVTLNWKIYKSL